jgi:hypothetical protein
VSGISGLILCRRFRFYLKSSLSVFRRGTTFSSPNGNLLYRLWFSNIETGIAINHVLWSYGDESDRYAIRLPLAPIGTKGSWAGPGL